jgi:hypothetical protein
MFGIILVDCSSGDKVIQIGDHEVPPG